MQLAAFVPLEWILDGRVLPFLWVSIGGAVVWLLLQVGRYGAEMGAREDGKVLIGIETPSNKWNPTFLVKKQVLQSVYRPFRVAAAAVFWAGCAGMAISASVAVLK